MGRGGRGVILLVVSDPGIGQRKSGRLKPHNAPVRPNPIRENPEGRFFFRCYFPRGMLSPHLEKKKLMTHQLNDLGQVM